jgi:hypothetical protein
MKTVFKYATALAVTGALAIAAAAPSQARDGRNTAAAIGFGAGALVGAAAASAAYDNYYRGPGYYEYGPAYAVEPGYVYEPAPAYVYEREPVYHAGSSYAYAPAGRCWVSTDNTRNYGYYGSCARSTVDTDAATLGSAKRNVRPIR